MTAEKPNILFLLADDLGWADVGFHGSAIRTPNLDRLAATGIELDQHYVCPVCTPTRAALLSGRHPGRFGVHATSPSNAPVFPDGYATLPAVLRDGGYATGLFGKWHLGSRPEVGPTRFGFDAAYGSLAGGVDPYNHRYKTGPFSETWHRNGRFVEERGHVTDLITDEAIRWIEQQQTPWFGYVPFTAVHFPVKAPQAWLDHYAGAHFDDDALRDASYRTYAAYTSHMDHAVGRLVETLARLCLADRTLVIFGSDNGSPESTPLASAQKYPGHQSASPRTGSNLPWRGKKGQLYEGGIHTPTIVSWPCRLPPGRMSRSVHVADWMPTLCGLAGCVPRTDPHWDGVDLWPLLEPAAGRPATEIENRAFYWNLRGEQFAVRQGRWKLIVREHTDLPPTELFDLEADPGEKNDLAGQQPAQVDRLRGLIEAQRRLDNACVRPEVSSPEVDDPETEP